MQQSCTTFRKARQLNIYRCSPTRMRHNYLKQLTAVVKHVGMRNYSIETQVSIGNHRQHNCILQNLVYFTVRRTSC